MQVLAGISLLLGLVVHHPGPAVHHQIWISGESLLPYLESLFTLLNIKVVRGTDLNFSFGKMSSEEEEDLILTKLRYIETGNSGLSWSSPLLSQKMRSGH